MAYLSEIQEQLKRLTNANISQSDIAKALKTGRANISLRIKNNSRLTFEEIKKIESYFKVSIYNPPVNTLERYFEPGLDVKSELLNAGGRISDIQNKNNLSDRQMAGLLDISEKEFKAVKSGGKIIDVNVICSLKQNFRVSADWILFGG